MGFRFRKRVSIIPGVKLNITSKGINSLSLGGKGATLNVGKKGAKTTIGIPGSGMSYSTKVGNSKRNLGFLLMPFIFLWFLLRSGYRIFSRFIGFLYSAFTGGVKP